MTDEERTMLKQLCADVHRIDEAFFKVPPGSPPGTQPLIVNLRLQSVMIQRASWGARALIWGIVTLAAIGGAVQVIFGWFGGSNG